MGQMKESALNGRARKNRSGGSGSEPDGWRGYVNVEIAEAHKTRVRELAKDGENVWRVIWDLVDGEYKLSISADPKHNSYNVSMTCRKPGDKNHGLTLTGRGGTVAGAAAAFVFKHRDILEGDWSANFQQRLVGIDEDYVG